MNIFVLYKDGVKPIAICEDKELVLGYMIQNELDIDAYSITEFRGKKAESIALNFDELYLSHDNDTNLILTNDESIIINRIYAEEQDKLIDTIKNLEHIISYYDMKEKHKQQLLQSHELLYKISGSKKLKRKIRLIELVGDLRSNGEHTLAFIKRSLVKIVDKISI